MIEVTVAPESLKEGIWKLYEEYSKELSSYHAKNKHRHYENPFDEYWYDTHRLPIGIFYDHELTGFCLLTETGVCYLIDEFYVHPLHRRRGFGKFAVEEVKKLCLERGRHEIIAANIYVNNVSAIAFWRSVGFNDTGRRIRISNVRMMETEAELCLDAKRL